MASDETNEFPSNEFVEPTDEFATNVNDAAADNETEPKPSWNRRKFLKAAALGAAAAALLGKDGSGRLRFGTSTALADVVTNVNCTANDVRIIGPGIIVNEPCNCSGTFDAKVRFRINNNTGTQRYCVTVHLCAGRNAAGQIVVPARDVEIGTIDPGEKDYEVTIPGYQCGTGLVCFGAAGSGADGGFAKGETCPPGQCCTIISWNVRANDPCPQPHGEIIKSKCRAQQVCIQGRGATLKCIANCEPTCGGTATLELCGTGGVAPYTFSLSDGTNTYQPASVSGNCATFNVAVTKTTTFTGTVTDSGTPPCPQQSNSVTLTVTPVQAPSLVQTLANCAGQVVLTATAVGGNQPGDQFNFSGAAGTVNGNTITLQPQLNGQCRTVSVTLTRGACTSGATSYSFSQCVNTSSQCPHPNA